MKFKLIAFVLMLTVIITSFTKERQSTVTNNNISAIDEKGLFKVNIMYPYAEGKTFNMEYYETKHMPMVAGFLGQNLVKYTIEKGLASGVPDQPMAYMAIGTFYVKSIDDYKASIGPNLPAIRADFANYTNVAPVILISEVVR